MTIYQIDKEIEELIASSIDEETGELLFDTDRLEELQLARDEKVENLACLHKNLVAEAKAIKAEEEALAKRRKSVESEAERTKAYLEYVLNGENFKSARCAVGHRSSESVEVGDGFVDWAKKNSPDLLRVKEPEADKTAIKSLLKSGSIIPFASLVKKTTIQIK